MTLLKGLTLFSGLSFVAYGGLCLASLSMVGEFQRFGLAKLRTPTGLLEVLGGVGLLVGLRWLPALRLSAGGLALLMLIAFGVRLRVGDGFLQSMPSFAFAAVNLFILLRSFQVF